MIKTVEWTSEGVRLIDQRLLPTEEKYLIFRSCEEVADAIKQMVVRGAPAIGVAAETDDAEEIKRRMVAEARAIFNDDIAANRALGRSGGELIPDGANVLT